MSRPLHPSHFISYFEKCDVLIISPLTVAGLSKLQFSKAVQKKRKNNLVCINLEKRINVLPTIDGITEM